MSKKHKQTEEPIKNSKSAETVEEQVTTKVEPKAVSDEQPNFEAQFEEMRDKYLRLSAEFDNYRKRTQREKMDLIKYASEDVLKSLLPVIDDFERAIKSTTTSTDIEAVKHGLQLIHSKFGEFLRTNGVQEVQAVGLELNTDVHEAITKVPVPDDAQKGKIIDVVEKGYLLNEKVIRFSKVVVGE